LGQLGFFGAEPITWLPVKILCWHRRLAAT
jgi:hypothetical protein